MQLIRVEIKGHVETLVLSRVRFSENDSRVKTDSPMHFYYFLTTIFYRCVV